jgi:hypothetical protein
MPILTKRRHLRALPIYVQKNAEERHEGHKDNLDSADSVGSDLYFRGTSRSAGYVRMDDDKRGVWPSRLRAFVSIIPGSLERRAQRSHSPVLTNIQLTYPGLTFDSAVASSIGFDFSASVDPTTGAFIFHDVGQGLAVIAFAGTDINSATTLLSITVDNPNQNLTGVADQFNALNNGSPFAGFPTAGFWTAEFPAAAATPLPATLPLFATGLGALGLLGWRRKKKTTAPAA